MAEDATVKGIQPSGEDFDGSKLRIAIVHARWNKTIIDALVKGAIDTLKERGVQDQSITVLEVPGSFELPFAVKSVIQGSKSGASSTAADLLGATGLLASNLVDPATTSNGPFDAVIAIGVLIKGSTMHFEYICDAVSHGLMRIQLETGTPVIFGVLTALTDDQALERAGIGRKENKGHNHGVDWGHAAVEMASKANKWSTGNFN
ncbi:hypothetical protein FRB90_000573 [Tulasnella sp. 427]|nr:hypothetical protein FRB90_000573 [Tulasnella sp. 427]